MSFDLNKSLVWGELNNFQETQAGSASRRRGDGRSYLTRALGETYSRDSLDSVQEFHGIVVARRMLTRAAYQKKGPFILSSTQQTSPVPATATDADESETLSANQPYYVYKVYIPELEPRPHPCSEDDPVIPTYKDVYPGSKVEAQYGPLPVGAVVRVAYSDLQNMLDPMIIGYNGSIQLAWGGTPEISIRNVYQGAPATVTPGNDQKVVLVGDSQTDRGSSNSWSTLGKYIPETLTERNLNVRTLAKVGRGVIASKEYFGISSPSGRLPELLNTFKPNLVIVELGGNDSDWGSRGDKKSTYEAELKLWVDTIKAAGVSEIKWFGPSYATKILDSGVAYDTQRQRIRDWQSAYLSTLGVTWYDMVPYTKDLAIKDDGVHFPAASYKTWTESLFAGSGPLASVRGQAGAST
tara:strand:- start:12264 stop:13493 length:1230 start_codon:yes stop_codon:yes gene_type:complete